MLVMARGAVAVLVSVTDFEALSVVVIATAFFDSIANCASTSWRLLRTRSGAAKHHAEFGAACETLNQLFEWLQFVDLFYAYGNHPSADRRRFLLQWRGIAAR